MAPTEKTLVARLKYTVERIFNGPNREDLTVKLVRDIVEEDLELEAGFFLSEKWKAKSKILITNYASKLVDIEEDSSLIPAKGKRNLKTKAKADEGKTVKKVANHASPEVQPRPQKRRRKDLSSSEGRKIFENSEPTTTEIEAPRFADSEESDVPKRKNQLRSTGKTASKYPKQRHFIEASSDEEAEERDNDSTRISTSSQKTFQRVTRLPRQNKQKRKKLVDSAESEDSKPKSPLPKFTPGGDDSDDYEERPAKNKSSAKNESLQKCQSSEDADSDTDQHRTKATDIASDSDSEMSIVIDELSRHKAKSKPKRKPSLANKPTTSEAKSTKAQPCDEATIKTLQSQLLKCGVRKIWQFELKSYGDDQQGRIRHLQGLLREIGMPARFSEAKARKIREMRELMADVEAVKEGEKNWGLERERGTRSRRGVKKENDDSNLMETLNIMLGKTSDIDDHSMEECASSADEKKYTPGKHSPTRRNRARGALNWLGDEEDSDK